MKKFIFSIFAICMCGPSFANICGNRKVIDGNKLLFYNSILNKLGEYTECDTNNDKRLMVGCDGKIYKCNDKKWELAYIQKPCPSGWGGATSQRIKPENTIANPTDTGDIYFFTPYQKIYVLEDSICKYTTDECNNDYDECIKDGRVPVNCTICDPAAGGKNTFTKCIYVKNGEKDISDVKFFYNGFKIKTNRETSIAKYDSTKKCYSIEWHPENNDDITISAPGYTPTTMSVNQLLTENNETIALEKGTTSNSTQSILNNPSQSGQMTLPETPVDACEYSGGNYRNNQCDCDSSKHLERYTPENASNYTICTCMRGYKRKNAEMDANGNTTWYPEGDECVDAGDYETHEEFDSAAWRRDTENAYKHERDNAQSWANKGVTAASTLMTGEGAMMAARAIAEQKADKKAEEQMTEWISKMGCEYGNGQPVDLGKEETLPAGDLAKYYTEYKQLADKLKETKTALNLRPGIESEVLYDRAETGLYQYQTAERQSGGFTSLSRALMNPDGTDAEQWNAQKAEVAKDLTTGTLLTAGGLVVGAAGNYLVNRNHKKEYQELEKKFKEIEEKLLIEYPEVFSIREDKPVIEIIEEETEEVPIPEQSVAPKRITLDNLTAKSGAFRSGYASLTDEGKKGVADAMQLITEQLDAYEIKAIKITATGHSDPEKIDSRYIARITNNYKQVVKQEYFSDMFDRIAENEQLSTARAQAVVTALLDQIKENSSLPWPPTYTATGFDGTECKKANYSECRYVDIKIELNVTEKQK